MTNEDTGSGDWVCPAPSCWQCLVREFAIYGSALKSDIDKLMRLRRGTRQIAERQLLMHEGQSPTELATLLSGWAFRFKLLPDGRRQILSFLLPGDLVVFHGLHDKALNFSVQTLTTVRLCVFDTIELRLFLKDRPHIRCEVEARYAVELAAADEMITDLGQKRAPGRIARLVLALEARLATRGLVEKGVFFFPLRQEHLADTLGLTAIHVSRTLTQLRVHGIISVTRDKLVVHDRERLLDLARGGK